MKILARIAAASLCLALAACGDGVTDSTPGGPSITLERVRVSYLAARTRAACG